MKNTRLSYSYKSLSGEVRTNFFVVSGVFSEEDIQDISRSLRNGCQFIPSQVGLKDLNASGDDDHVWHSLNLAAMRTSERPSIPYSAHEFSQAVSSTLWNPLDATRKMYASLS